MSMDPKDAALLALERMTRLFEEDRTEMRMAYRRAACAEAREQSLASQVKHAQEERQKAEQAVATMQSQMAEKWLRDAAPEEDGA